MTLLEMIKKYEKVRKDIVESCHVPFGFKALADDSLEVVDHILKDLRGILEESSVLQANMRYKTLCEINKAMDKGRYTDDDLIKLLSILS